MAEQKKPAAKKPAKQTEPVLTRDQQRLLERHERREALRRLQGISKD